MLQSYVNTVILLQFNLVSWLLIVVVTHNSIHYLSLRSQIELVQCALIF